MREDTRMQGFGGPLGIVSVAKRMVYIPGHALGSESMNFNSFASVHLGACAVYQVRTTMVSFYVF